MRLLVPVELRRRLGELRAVSAEVEPGLLQVRRRRPPWARAAGVAVGLGLSHRLARPLRARLARTERLAFRVDGAPLTASNGGEALLVTWDLDGPAIRALVDALPGLRWIHSTSTGTDRFDVEDLHRRGVALTAPRGLHSRRVAEFVMGIVYADAKRLEGHLRPGRRPRASPPAAIELGRLTLGVVGYGAIGREVARLARANGLEVQALVRPGRPAPPLAGVTTTTELGQVLAASDVLVLALPLTGETRGFLGAAALRSLRRGAVLINVGRASTMVAEDLLAALGDGTVRRAYLDMLRDDDDVPPEDPLLRHPRVTCTWHQAARSATSSDEIFAGFLGNLRRYCAGAPLAGAVAPPGLHSGQPPRVLADGAGFVDQRRATR